MKRFGSVVREARRSKGLTLEAVAQQIGSHRGYLSAVENSRISPPKVQRVVQLARILRLEPKTLVKRAVVERAPRMVRAELERLIFPKEKS